MERQDESSRHQGLQRFLTDLRLGLDRRGIGERRSDERRASRSQSRRERRSGEDRRHRAERRGPPVDRRRPLGEQFAFEDTLLLQRMAEQLSEPVACPQCRSNLLLGPPDTYAGTCLREIHCTGCRRHAAIPLE